MEIKVIGEKKKTIKGVHQPMSVKMKCLSCLIGIIIVAGLAWVSLLVVQAASRHARRNDRAKNLWYVGEGLKNYSAAHRHLPNAVRLDQSGRPIASWRYDILKYVENLKMDTIPNKRWDDPAQEEWYKSALGIYCFSPDANPEETASPKSRHTNVMAVTGPDTAFDGQKRRKLLDLDKDTILAVEVADTGVHWMEPGDLAIDKVPASLVKGVDGDGFCVLFSDGAVWFLRSDVPLEDVKKFFTIEGSKKHDREELLGPYAGVKQ